MISIIGGGIGGLTLALALAFEKLGVEYNLYERAETLTEVGAGIWIPPNALQVLQWIDQDLFDQIKEGGNVIDRIVLGDSKLKPISDTDQGFIKNIFGFSTIAIHRGKLQSILYEFANKEKIKLGKSSKYMTKNGLCLYLFDLKHLTMC
ncbi:hypothetical protein [Aquimarina sp. I32.4]|uniref:hypothetical protein n=1 Tax=Aquimarina sp. I32.4 TaxID=2053903 RepID=UPI000CDED580|nr:hypothetical protein [Aquimarina sp. I32.4]